MKISMTLYLAESSARFTDSAERTDISCSPDRPPNRTATLILFKRFSTPSYDCLGVGAKALYHDSVRGAAPKKLEGMRWQILVFVWLTANAAAISIGVFWRVPPGKLPYNWLIAVAISTASVCVYSFLIWRRRASYLRRLENYAASMPASVSLPAHPPAEFAMLASALQRASEHAGSVIERANLELARRETILAGMAEGVLAVDAHLQVTFCNEAFAAAFRIRKPVPEGRPLYEVVREPALREILSEVIRTGEPALHNLRLPAAEGRSFEIHAIPFGDPHSKAAIAVLHDITGIEKQEQS
jgi:PAS domain-containing protein